MRNIAHQSKNQHLWRQRDTTKVNTLAERGKGMACLRICRIASDGHDVNFPSGDDNQSESEDIQFEQTESKLQEEGKE